MARACTVNVSILKAVFSVSVTLDTYSQHRAKNVSVSYSFFLIGLCVKNYPFISSLKEWINTNIHLQTCFFVLFNVELFLFCTS
jgi:hypothetical protein